MSLFKRFVRYYRPYRGIFYADMFCATVASAVELALPLIFSYLTRTVFFLDDKHGLISILLWWAGAIFVLYLVRMLCQYFITSWGHIMGAKMEADMRRDLFAHLEKLSFSYYDNNNTGRMMSRIVSDLFDIAELAHHGPEDLFISAIKIIGSFSILFLINWQVTLVLMGVTVLLVIFSFFYNRKMRAVFLDNRAKIADVNALVQDSLEGIRVVQSFSNEDVEREKFEEGNYEFFLSKKRNYLMMGKYFSGNGFLQGMMYLSVVLTGGIFVARGQITPADIVVYILYINMFLEPVNRLVNFTEQFQKGLSGFQRMAEILDTEPEVADRPDAVNAGVLQGDVRFEGVSFGYKDALVLKNIDAVIPAGKTVALVGSSGVGKTTFCSLIPRFYDVTGGTVSIGGRDVREFTLSSLRRNVGVVQQDVYIFGSTVRDNIAYGKPDATEDEIVDAAKRANIHEFIETLPDGYDTQVGERGVQFSGGQKQRLSIARVFLKNPPILILDEATSSLDNESEKIVQDSLAELSKNRTTLIIAHRLSTVRNADEILVLTEDGIAERGSHRELLEKDGLYAGLYNMQFDLDAPWKQ